MNVTIKNLLRAMATGAVAIAAFCLLPTWCYAENTSVILQQSPANGGQINPGSGVHQFGLDSEINLKASPQPGYRFVYWLGDVSDSSSMDTVTYIDGPKIIIAVFEREEGAALQEGTFKMNGDIENANFQAGTITPEENVNRLANEPSKQQSTQEDIYPLSNSFYDESDPSVFNEPVPEPATGLLIILGSLLTGKTCKKRR